MVSSLASSSVDAPTSSQEVATFSGTFHDDSSLPSSSITLLYRNRDCETSSLTPSASCLDCTLSTGKPIWLVHVSISDFTGLPDASSSASQRSAVRAFEYRWASKYRRSPSRNVSGVR